MLGAKKQSVENGLARVTLFHTGKKPQGQAFNHVMDVKLSLQKEGWKDARAAYRK